MTRNKCFEMYGEIALRYFNNLCWNFYSLDTNIGCNREASSDLTLPLSSNQLVFTYISKVEMFIEKVKNTLMLEDHT